MHHVRLQAPALLLIVMTAPRGLAADQSAPQAAPAPADDSAAFAPVTIEVVDKETLEPLSGFRCSWWFETPQPLPEDRPRHGEMTVNAEDGRFRIKIPAACHFSVHVEKTQYLPGRTSRDFAAEDEERHLLVELHTGTKVRGVVRNTEGDPVAGARVMPVVFTPPLFTGDRDRAVVTDEQGRFELGGVESDLGIEIDHPDYLTSQSSHDGFEVAEDGTISAEITLEAGVTVQGIVQDKAGRPIAGVAVESYDGKTTTTGQDGTFVLKSLNTAARWQVEGQYSLSLEAEGFIREHVSSDVVAPARLTIVLRPRPALSGRVVGAGGEPIGSFEAHAGPGEEPDGFECSSTEGRDGSFELTVREEGPAWVAIKAPGYAMWEQRVEKAESAGPIEARLERGSTIRGRLRLPLGILDSVSVRAVPLRADNEDRDRIRFEGAATQRQLVGTVEAQVSNGTFTLEHVHTGQYTLYVWGKGITPLEKVITVGTTDLDLGTLTIRGTGTIVGRAYQPKGDAAMTLATGEATLGYGGANSPIRPISFTTDADGRFRIADAPVGTVSLGFHYMITADIIGTHVRHVKVLENQESQVRFFDPSGEWDAIIRVMVGDGSEDQLNAGAALASRHALEYRREQAAERSSEQKPAPTTQPTSEPADEELPESPEFDVPLEDEPPSVTIGLTPAGEQPLSFPSGEQGELNTDIVLQDVAPGRYRVSLSIDRQMERLSRVVDIIPDMAPIEFTLPSGSIAGRIEPSESYYSVDAITQDRQVIRTWTAEGGAWAVRFLEPGDYTLFVRGADAGWAKLGPFRVDHSMVDAGVHKLATGASLTGTVPVVQDHPPADALVAVDANGIEVGVPEFEPGQPFTLANLWPGRWRVVLKSGEQVVAEGRAELAASENVTVALTAVAASQPSR